MVNAKSLVGAWVHFHEKDVSGELTYTSAKVQLPPSRGRSGFELKTDGTARLTSPGATDAGAASPARWNLDGSDLEIVPVDSARQALRFHVLLVTKEKLLLKR